MYISLSTYIYIYVYHADVDSAHRYYANRYPADIHSAYLFRKRERAIVCSACHMYIYIYIYIVYTYTHLISISHIHMYIIVYIHIYSRLPTASCLLPVAYCLSAIPYWLFFIIAFHSVFRERHQLRALQSPATLTSIANTRASISLRQSIEQ